MDFMKVLKSIAEDQKKIERKIDLTAKQVNLLDEFNRLEDLHDKICADRKIAKEKFWKTVEVEHGLIGRNLAVRKNEKGDDEVVLFAE